MLKTFLGFLTAFTFLAAAGAWDDGGHLLIARIACDRLSPEKQARLTAALAGLTFGPNSYADPCRAAIYMDKLRDGTRSFHPPYPGAFQSWHFVQLDFTADGGPLPHGSPDANGRADVIRGWRRCRAIVVHQTTGPESYLGRSFTVGRREALAMLMHLTGDAHQPLHTTSHRVTGISDDRGGNSVDILNLKPKGNLHHFWDSAYRQVPVAQPGGGVVIREDATRVVPRDSTLASPGLAAQARSLVANFAPTAAASHLRSPESWVKESHRDGVEFGYDALGAELGKKEITLSAKYVRDANAVASRRLVLAGYRLAVFARFAAVIRRKRSPMKIVTWNVNGVRAREAQVREWIAQNRPDVVCLQELKATPAQVPALLGGLEGYWSYWHGERAYSGVALLVRKEFSAERPRFAHPHFDMETRIVTAQIGEVTVASIYVPNGGKDYPAKLRFLEALEEFAGEFQATADALVLCGDINIARSEIDVHPKERKAVIGQLPEERALFERLLSRGLVDLGRAFEPDNEALFTWWAPWREMRARHIGWRLDYVLASSALAAKSCAVDAAFGTSDHAPVVAEFR